MDAYERALTALAPPSDDLVAGEAPKDMPIRVVPTAVVEFELATLPGLPDMLVDSVDLEWRRWKLVIVRLRDTYGPSGGQPGNEHGHSCLGFLLVWDGTKREWRSLLPCATVVSLAMSIRFASPASSDRSCRATRSSTASFSPEARCFSNTTGATSAAPGGGAGPVY